MFICSMYVSVWVYASSLVLILWVKIPADAQQPDSEVKHFRACFHWFIAPGRAPSPSACVCVCERVCEREWQRQWYRQKLRQKARVCVRLHPKVCACVCVCECVSVSVYTRCYCPKQRFRPTCVSWLGAQWLWFGCSQEGYRTKEQKTCLKPTLKCLWETRGDLCGGKEGWGSVRKHRKDEGVSKKM